MSDQSPPCSSAAYLSIALSLDYAQNPLRRNTLTRFGANRRRKLALWPDFDSYASMPVPPKSDQITELHSTGIFVWCRLVFRFSSPPGQSRTKNSSGARFLLSLSLPPLDNWPRSVDTSRPDEGTYTWP